MYFEEAISGNVYIQPLFKTKRDNLNFSCHSCEFALYFFLSVMIENYRAADTFKDY